MKKILVSIILLMMYMTSNGAQETPFDKMFKERMTLQKAIGNPMKTTGLSKSKKDELNLVAEHLFKSNVEFGKHKVRLDKAIFGMIVVYDAVMAGKFKNIEDMATVAATYEGYNYSIEPEVITIYDDIFRVTYNIDGVRTVMAISEKDGVYTPILDTAVVIIPFEPHDLIVKFVPSHIETLEDVIVAVKASKQ